MTDLGDAQYLSDEVLMLLLFTNGSKAFQARVIAHFMMQAMWVINDG